MKIKLFDDLFLLQRLDQLIRTRATGTPCDLAERLGTSKRDVYRLIGSLRDQGFPVAYDRDNGTYLLRGARKIGHIHRGGRRKTADHPRW